MAEMYFKVYADKDNMTNYYVDTYDNIIENGLDDFMLNHLEDGELMPVIEPVMMTEKEFKKLPEFTGF